MTCCNITIPSISECKTLNLNRNIRMYFTGKSNSKHFKLLAKQYHIDSIDCAGDNGYFNEFGNWTENYKVDECIVKLNEPNYKIEYSDKYGNQFFWLLESNEININYI